MSNDVIRMKRSGRKDYNFEEAIKTLRTNVQFSGNNLKAIMVTSSIPDEGKSEISFALAASMAQLNKKVLLIDADIRKSVFASRYNLEQEVYGLSQYLSGQRTKEEVIYPTNVNNMNMIFAGPFSPNASELLGDALFDELLSHGKENYDYVIIDTPPLGSVIDGAVVAKKCDGAVIVIESGIISRRLLQKVKAQIENSGCRILGAVLNKVDIQKNSYYSYHYNKYFGYYNTY